MIIAISSSSVLSALALLAWAGLVFQPPLQLTRAAVAALGKEHSQHCSPCTICLKALEPPLKSCLVSNRQDLRIQCLGRGKTELPASSWSFQVHACTNLNTHYLQGCGVQNSRPRERRCLGTWWPAQALEQQQSCPIQVSWNMARRCSISQAWLSGQHTMQVALFKVLFPCLCFQTESFPSFPRTGGLCLPCDSWISSSASAQPALPLLLL